MLNGSARIAAVDTEGRTFIDDVSKGDVWVCISSHLRCLLEKILELIIGMMMSVLPKWYPPLHPGPREWNGIHARL